MVVDSWRDALPEEEWSPRVAGAVHALQDEALEAATRILRLLPQIEQLTIRTTEGPVVVDRQPSASAWRAADRVVMALLASDPTISGVTAHSSDSDDGTRHATPEDPFMTRDGARAAVIRASEASGEITTSEAERREQWRLGGHDDVDLLDTWWSVPPLHD